MKTVKVGIVGVGRLGKIHAANIAQRIPGAELVAACSIVPAELEFVKNEFGVLDLYSDYDEMLAKADIEAVVIVTTSAMHCSQIEKALKAGKHVFCEKPLGVTIDECLSAEKIVAENPDKVFMLGFMRRFDPSYVYAKKKIEEGLIGTPYLVKATGVDPVKGVEGAIPFLKTSGGLYLDMAIHDIDLIRWFLGSEAETVYALGSAFGFPVFKEFNDAETGCALMKFQNGGMGIIHSGRCAAHGYHIETEIVGTKGSIRISPVPQKNLAQLYIDDGVVTECVGAFPERFAEAYLAEVTEFINCILEGRKPDVYVTDGTMATRVAFAATESFKSGELVRISY